ncbi:DJ-1/PfpI family protein [Actinoallomurus bryophytorum]|uniref:DJ-1/PfpI family protein n=1 Tax=Actinoallomurus bryophytorum TaxID=1490222 RepID=A0A543C019_9ACTN|nr:DJ-1/PfpI family protein [Actinoallomurus bryophytorum]TQL90424.1 DJ-1/PfpI family protein [Actinoallomurus bryophytorum]
MTDKKTIAFVLYPGLTALDFVGPLQVLAVLESFGLPYEAVTVAAGRDAFRADSSVWFTASHTFAEVTEPYGLIVPGGGGPTFTAMTDETLLGYVRDAARTAAVVGSVCTGSLILGAAGLLTGRRATTHWAAMPMLAAFGAEPVTRRWVRDGPVLTAAGVSAGIDMALHLVGELAGEDAARQVQLAIEYDPRPPFGPIDWDTTDRALVEAWMTQEATAALEAHPDLRSRLLTGGRAPR